MRNLILLLFCLVPPLSVLANIHTFDILVTPEQFYKNVVLDRLGGDSLYVKAYGQTFTIPVDSIRYLKRERSSNAAAGVFLGALVGGLAGNQIARGADDHSGFGDAYGHIAPVTFGTASGVFLGAAFGYAITKGLGGDQYYPVDKLSAEEKRTLLNELIHKYRAAGE